MASEAGVESRCPYLGLEDDPETWFAFSSDSNYCHRVSPAEPVARHYQSEACLSENFAGCPIFRAAANWRGRLPREMRRSGSEGRRRRTHKPGSGAKAGPISAARPTSKAGPARAGRRELLIGAAAVMIIALVAVSAFLGFSTIREGLSVYGPPTATPAQIPALAASPGELPTAMLPTAIVAPPTLTPTSPTTSTSPPPTATATPTASPEPVGGATYVVQSGDNLYRIALRYGITVDAILRINDLANPNLLHAGQVIRLPGGEPSEEGEEAAEPTATTTHVVQPGENLFRIALHYGTTINALAAYNGLTDSRRIEVGQVLIVPLTGAAAQAAPAAEGPVVASPEGIAVQIGNPIYAGDRRVAEVPITVSNQSLTPAVAGGRYYIVTNPDGNRRWITLLRAAHQEVPVPILAEPTPLWHAVVTLTDGTTFDAYAGCIYQEQILAEGYEPSALGGPLHWSVRLEDGWFDCGNAYQVKPEDLAPGQSATVPLTVYIMSPRDSGPLTRSIRRIELELWRSDGVSLGVVAARDYQ
jgi:LysM repeat protein